MLSSDGVKSAVKDLLFVFVWPLSMLKLLYTSPLGDIIKRHKLDFYFYTDDTQIHFAFKSNAAEQQQQQGFFFHLRSLAEIRDCLSISDTEALVHAFISCNSLLNGPP